MRVPYDGVGVEVFSRIEPKTILHLSVTFPFCIDVSVQGVWFTSGVPQELKVNLVMVFPWPLCHQLFLN